MKGGGGGEGGITNMVVCKDVVCSLDRGSVCVACTQLAHPASSPSVRIWARDDLSLSVSPATCPKDIVYHCPATTATSKKGMYFGTHTHTHTHTHLQRINHIGGVWWTYYKGMVTAFLEFHNEVYKTSNTALNTFTQCLVVLCENPAA